MAVAKHLNFDVTRLGHELLDKDTIVAKGIGRFVLGALEAFTRACIIPSNPHALAATACTGLDHHRIADLI